MMMPNIHWDSLSVKARARGEQHSILVITINKKHFLNKANVLCTWIFSIHLFLFHPWPTGSKLVLNINLAHLLCQPSLKHKEFCLVFSFLTKALTGFHKRLLKQTLIANFFCCNRPSNNTTTTTSSKTRNTYESKNNDQKTNNTTTNNCSSQ